MKKRIYICFVTLISIALFGEMIDRKVFLKGSAFAQQAVCVPADPVSSMTDTNCSQSGKCGQICIGSDCRSEWPNQPLQSYTVTCKNEDPGGACQLCCQAGFTLCNSSCGSCLGSGCRSVLTGNFSAAVTRTCCRQ